MKFFVTLAIWSIVTKATLGQEKTATEGMEKHINMEKLRGLLHRESGREYVKVLPDSRPQRTEYIPGEYIHDDDDDELVCNRTCKPVCTNATARFDR